MQLVLLAGELGEKYGKQHEYYNLQTPADAIKLLCINYPSLREEMVQAHHNGVGYKVIQGGSAMGYDELMLPFGSKPLLVVPVISGSGGSSTTQILLGVGLVALAIANPAVGFGLGGAAGFGAGAVGTAATATLGASLTALGGNLGIALILGGTASLISPQPTLANPNADRIKGEGTNVRGSGPDGVSRGASGTQSYAFSGPANSVGTGATLPVIYGKVITGSHLVAIDLDITDESDPQKTAIQTPSLKTLTVNGEFLSTEGKNCAGLVSRLGHTPKDFVVNSSAGMTGQQSVRFPRHKIENVFGPKQAYAEQLEIQLAV
jgi:predicted phage tail protein